MAINSFTQLAAEGIGNPKETRDRAQEYIQGILSSGRLTDMFEAGLLHKQIKDVSEAIIHDLSYPELPDKPTDIPQNFDPFSIAVGGIAQFTPKDPEYKRICDDIAITLYPEVFRFKRANYPPNTHGTYLKASNSIVKLLKAADPDKVNYRQMKERITEAAKYGIDIIPGKGITFRDPEAIALANRTQVLANPIGKSTGNWRLVPDNLLEFLRLHTN